MTGKLIATYGPFVIAVASLFGFAGLNQRYATGQERPAEEAPWDPTAKLPTAEAEQFLQLVADLVRSNLPAQHVDEKHWNKAKEVYAGVHFRRDGWNIETKRRWRTVNHGLWRRFQVDLIDPNQFLELTVSNVVWLPNGRLQFSLQATAAVKIHVRQARWNLDIRLYSAHVEARAKVQLDVDANVGFQIDPTVFPPALALDPVVNQATLRMTSLEVDRIGHIGGDAAEEIGNAVEGLIQSEIIKPQSEKLAEKINRQIDKRRDRLRVSMGDWLQDWFKTENGQSPAPKDSPQSVGK
jgi:hypothetical protein